MHFKQRHGVQFNRERPSERPSRTALCQDPGAGSIKRDLQPENGLCSRLQCLIPPD